MGTIYIENKHSYNVEVVVKEYGEESHEWHTWEWWEPETGKTHEVKYGHNPVLHPGDHIEVKLNKDERVVIKETKEYGEL